mmetsp:Transcript_42590/g.83767  ORF Transcript_42590/g.83767 Transcript_42590/m.83767 type:complete len:390 (-) Transcript_42590:334-1503(-)
MQYLGCRCLHRGFSMSTWLTRAFIIFALFKKSVPCKVIEKSIDCTSSDKKIYGNLNPSKSFHDQNINEEEKQTPKFDKYINRQQELEKKYFPRRMLFKNTTENNANVTYRDDLNIIPSLLIRRSISPFEITLYGMGTFLDADDLHILDVLIDSMMELKFLTDLSVWGVRSVSFINQGTSANKSQKYSSKEEKSTVSLFKNVEIEIPERAAVDQISSDKVDSIVKSFFLDINYLLTLIVNLKLSSDTFEDVYDMEYHRSEFDELNAGTESNPSMMKKLNLDTVDSKTYEIMAYFGAASFFLLVLAGLTSAPSRNRLKLLYSYSTDESNSVSDIHSESENSVEIVLKKKKNLCPSNVCSIESSNFVFDDEVPKKTLFGDIEELKSESYYAA